MKITPFGKILVPVLGFVCLGNALTSLGQAADLGPVLPLVVQNPSFELLSGTSPIYFDPTGKLLPAHYSEVIGFPILPIGFHSTDPIPGWTSQDSAGTINYQGLSYFPGGMPDGQNCAWINVTGKVSQTLAETFAADVIYQLSVDVGALAGITFPGYTVGLYANGQPVVVDNNSVAVAHGTFQTITVSIQLPANSPAIGAPIEIRLGIPGSQPDQVVFDNVKVTAQAVINSAPVVNPSFELLTGTDPTHFNTSGKLLPGHYSEVIGFPILPIGFHSADPIPGWTSQDSAGTINYQGLPYFPSGMPDGQNCAWINVTGKISQTLTEKFVPNLLYRLSVDVGALAGIAFPGYTIGLYANGQPVAVDNNSVVVPQGSFQTVSVSAQLAPDSPAIGAPIEIRLGIPGSQPDQVVFDKVKVTSQYGFGTSCAPASPDLVLWYQGEDSTLDRARNHGTTFTGAKYGTGKVGQAFEFDGSNEVVVANSADLDFSTFTAEAWVFPTALDGEVEIIFNKEINGYDSIAFELGLKGIPSLVANQVPPGNLLFHLGGIAGLPSDYTGWTDSKANVPLNQWSHVALAFKDGQAQCYLNGLLVSSFGNLSGALRTTTGALKIGSRSTPVVSSLSTVRFNGKIDEPSLYSRALTASEITAIYSASSAGKCSTCVQPESLVTWLRAEGDASDATSAHPGTFTAPKFAAGKVGQAFDFDGSNEVVLGNAPEFNSTTFTLEAWVYPTSLDGAVDIIANKESGIDFSQFQFEIGIKGPVIDPGATSTIPQGNLAVHLAGVTGLPNEYGGWTDGKAAIPLNQWTHVALAVQPGAVVVYVNGVETRNLIGLGGAVQTTTGPLKVGSRNDGFTNFRPGERFNGRIDEFSFYTRSLAASEIAAIYAAGELGKCPLPPVTPLDTEAPALSLSEPAAGTVTDDHFNLRGTATDNIGVSSVTWTWNGASKGSLAVSGGQFAANGLVLEPGVNTFAVTATDAAGNHSTVTREVTLAALRTLRIANGGSVQEGKRLSFTVELDHPGDVAGMTFHLAYDPTYLADPQFEWASEVGQSVNNVNLAVAGEISASFALPGTSLTSGRSAIGSVSFRARSVPFVLDTELSPRIDSLSSLTGDALARGNAVAAGTGQIKPRRITGDNNANQRLDVGDAVVISRLQVGLEEQRSWDVALNDLNHSLNLDSGDVVKVLRTVVGLDSQPSPTGLIARQEVARSATPSGERAVLEFPDGPIAKVGQPYSVVVKIAEASDAVAGLSFVLDYPGSLTLTSRQLGSLVPPGTFPLWNTDPGSVHLAAVSAGVWPANEGVAAVLTFLPQESFAAQSAWPLQLRQVELTGSGFDVRSVEGADAVIKSVALPEKAPTLVLAPVGDGTFRLEVRGEAGSNVLLESSADLQGWSEQQTVAGQGYDTPVFINLGSNPTGSFWRATHR